MRERRVRPVPTVRGAASTRGAVDAGVARSALGAPRLSQDGMRRSAESALERKEKQTGVGTDSGPTPISTASYRELRTRGRRDRRCRHFPSCPADLRSSPGRPGFLCCSSRFDSRPPGATPHPQAPDGRGCGAGVGSRNLCHTPPQGRPR